MGSSKIYPYIAAITTLAKGSGKNQQVIALFY
jgi:hypothetical protein